MSPGVLNDRSHLGDGKTVRTIVVPPKGPSSPSEDGLSFPGPYILAGASGRLVVTEGPSDQTELPPLLEPLRITSEGLHHRG